MRELNLLPPHRRRYLRTESILVSVNTTLRTIVFGLLLVTAGALVTGAVLWFLVLTASTTTPTELVAVVDDYRTLRSSISEQNAALEKMDSFGKQRIVWSTFLRDLLAVVPPGVVISTIEAETGLDDGAFKPATLAVEGQAITRSTLIILQARLHGLDQVQSVVAPTSNLLDRNNPSYRFELTVQPAQNL